MRFNRKPRLSGCSSIEVLNVPGKLLILFEFEKLTQIAVDPKYLRILEALKIGHEQISDG